MTAPVTNKFISPQTPFSATAIATTADVAFSAPVNIVTLVDDVADNLAGMRLTSLYAITRATLAASLNCLIYKKVATTYTLLDSALLGTVTPSATVANGKIDFGYSDDNPLILKAGVGLVVAIGTTVSNGVVFATRGGAY